jgi:hypothetical protein
MTDSLRIQIYLDDDGTAELSARVEANGFSGAGSAWIHSQDLTRLAISLGQEFPLRETLGISGGEWIGAPAVLEQEHLGLSFYPVGGRGVVGCQVRIASPVYAGDRPQAKHVVQAELLSSYQELQEFALALRRLASGESDEAVSCARGLTIHSSRSRFAARLNSGVRAHDRLQQ